MKDRYKHIAAAVTIVVSAACIAFGVYRGETADVLTKAVNICFECIGLG